MNILFLDVDGVINSFSDRPPRKNSGWLGEWRAEKIGGVRVLWSVELIERLNALADRPDVEIVWATDWRSEAPEILSGVIGAKGRHWAVLDPSDAHLEAFEPWWKHDYIREYLDTANPDRAIWVDDNLHNAKNARYWLAERGENFLGLATNPYHGLTRGGIKIIENYFSVDSHGEMVIY
jgi:hypothetical protein